MKNEQFVMNLVWKLLNIASEIDSEDQLDKWIVKNLITGDPITWKVIYQKPMDFINTAKLVFATNNLPYLKDWGIAVNRRLDIIEFNRIFQEQERNYGLRNELREELSEIMLWAFEGLKRFNTRWRFKTPASIKDFVNRYVEESDSVLQLIAEEFEITQNPSDRIVRGDIYEDYKNYCIKNGFKPVCSRKFYERATDKIWGTVKSNGKHYFTCIKRTQNTQLQATTLDLGE